MSFKSDVAYEEWAHEVYQVPFLERKGVTFLERYEPFHKFGDYRILWHDKEYNVEFKVERLPRENLALEHWSDKGNNPGWMMKSEADLLIYLVGGNSKKPRNIIMKMPKLRKWFADTVYDNPKFRGRIREPDSNEWQDNQTEFYAIPIEMLEQEGLWLKSWILKPKGKGPGPS
ncbi:MAG: hypothetical protein DRQ39_05580 [Gammaproteobacteria bacterium]|nr:MAG: hypothetical protein DRQ39_05580 [Gammaproteobacteria bacterium]